MSERVDANELTANLLEYQGQLQQVETLLLSDPENEEYRGIYDGLTEVIQLTKDVLVEAQQQASAAAPKGSGPPPSAAVGPVAAITRAPEVRIPSVLPPQVAEQIRFAQQRAALGGQAPPAWAIGAQVQAVYSGDGQWYDCVVTAVGVTGNFIVSFEGYGTQEEVDKMSIRERFRTAENEGAGYTGVAAPKRRQVDNEAAIEEMPAWLDIKATDDDKTKARKRKLQKNFKSKQRFQVMDATQKQKADAWKTFVSGKGSKKYKRDSMFKVPEGVQGKVGITGSGQGMTDYAKRKRHDYLADSSHKDDGRE